ncbi:methyl-accepting chemotaxis protein [Paraburkholderia sp. 32]|uniref:methyl-accepting chemotaxis protein n=1 Tax=Paraburkholderia sp. 32 TaxID=2991057 RepID=UPI003D1CE637
MTLSRRLLLTLSITLLALILVGCTGLWWIYLAQQRFEYVQENILPSITELNEVKLEASDLARLSARYFLVADDVGRTTTQQSIDELNKSIDQHIATYGRDDVSNDTDRQMLETDKTNLTAFRATLQGFQAKVRSGDLNDARVSLTIDMARDGAKLNAVLNSHIDYNRKLSNDLRAANDDAYSQALWLLLSCIALALLVSGTMGLRLYRSINSGLNGIQRTLQQVSQSLDLTCRAKVVRMDEIGLTATAFNALLARVAEVVADVGLSATSVSVASRQIATGNTDLSQRTEEQAASLEETASSMEELTATVRQNADNARQATTLANTASEVALRGGEVVGLVVDTMHGISDSSSKVGEIIAVIEGIAFQTNILALNAAVEAARAGEQGRGFAVVAGEVRTLAQRSATAAKEIKELIGESVSRANAGSKLVEEAGSTINEVVESVKRVADIIGEISSASEEQRTGIEQVNQAVIQMDQVTQQNAALVEEASAAAQSMTEQAQALQSAVAVLKTAPESSTTVQIAKSRKTLLSAPLAYPAPISRSATRKTAPTIIADKTTAVENTDEAAEWQTF